MGDEFSSVRWGLDIETELVVKSPSIGDVIQINKYEYLAITRKELLKFDLVGNMTYYPYYLTAMCFINHLNLIVSVDAKSKEFIFFVDGQMDTPRQTGVSTCESHVFSIQYMRKSSSLVVTGSRIRIWSFEFIPTPKTVVTIPPKLVIAHRALISGSAHNSLINPPLVDENDEKVFCEDERGYFSSFSASGALQNSVFKPPPGSTSAYAISQDSKTILSQNTQLGTRSWYPSGISIRSFVVSNTTPLTILFLDEINALIIDANSNMMILDTSTGRTFTCVDILRRVNRAVIVNFEIPRVILNCGNSIVVLKVSLPWRLWSNPVTTPTKIERINRQGKAARVLVNCGNAAFKFYSPKNGVIITAATLISTEKATGCIYDNDRLIVFLPETRGKVISVASDPCEEILEFEGKITDMCVSLYQGNKVYAGCSETGNLILFDPFTFKQIVRHVIIQSPAVRVFSINNVILFFLADRAMTVDIESGRVLSEVYVKPSDVFAVFDNKLSLGYSNGEIAILTIDDNIVTEHSSSKTRIHTGKVTGISAGTGFYVTCSVDCKMRVWTEEFSLMREIIFPLPLFSVTVLNGRRDIILGTVHEIMIVEGRGLFNGEIDEEDEAIDNFDRKDDTLGNDTGIENGVSLSDNEGSVLRESARGNIESLDSPAETIERKPIGEVILLKAEKSDKKALLEEMEKIDGLTSRRRNIVPKPESEPEPETEPEGINEEEDYEAEEEEVDVISNSEISDDIELPEPSEETIEMEILPTTVSIEMTLKFDKVETPDNTDQNIEILPEILETLSLPQKTVSKVEKAIPPRVVEVKPLQSKVDTIDSQAPVRKEQTIEKFTQSQKVTPEKINKRSHLQKTKNSKPSETVKMPVKKESISKPIESAFKQRKNKPIKETLSSPRKAVTSPERSINKRSDEKPSPRVKPNPTEKKTPIQKSPATSSIINLPSSNRSRVVAPVESLNSPIPKPPMPSSHRSLISSPPESTRVTQNPKPFVPQKHALLNKGDVYDPGELQHRPFSFTRPRSRSFRVSSPDSLFSLYRSRNPTRPKTPPPKRTMVSLSPAPYGIVFDIETLKRLADHGDQKCIAILRSLKIEIKEDVVIQSQLPSPRVNVGNPKVPHYVRTTTPLSIEMPDDETLIDTRIPLPSDDHYIVSEPFLSPRRPFVKQNISDPLTSHIRLWSKPFLPSPRSMRNPSPSPRRSPIRIPREENKARNSARLYILGSPIKIPAVRQNSLKFL